MDHNTTDAPLTFVDLAGEIIHSARIGDYCGAAQKLARLTLLLQDTVTSGAISSEGLSKITYSLETLFTMQKMEDWVAFADVLEYELSPLWQRYTRP